MKVCLRSNEVLKLEASLAISALTRSTQAKRLEGCSVEGEVEMGEEQEIELMGEEQEIELDTSVRS